MRKNLFKKLAVAVLTAAMAISAMVAVPSEVKAATDKVIYLQTDEDATYSIGLWSGYSGITLNAELMSGSDWQYDFTKVEDGVYKISISTDSEVTLVGLQIYKNGDEIAKSDAQWSADGGAFNSALEEALNSDYDTITISDYSTENWNFSKVETSSSVTPPDDSASDDTPSGDFTMSVVYLAIAAGTVITLVVSRKRTAVN